MSLFIPAPTKDVEIKDGYLNGHRIQTAHVKGTDIYRVIVDNLPAVEVIGRDGFAEYIRPLCIIPKE